MIKPFFSSSSETKLIQVVYSFFEEITSLAQKNKKIEIHIMTFSFTEKFISDRLLEIVKAHKNVTIKIIADWGNISEEAGRRVYSLAKLNLENLQVRFKYDQPYLWDETHQKLLWNYNTSLGLLHHRTAVVVVDKKPIKLLTGSFNWTKSATKNHENLILLTAFKDSDSNLLNDFEEEFEVIWNDSNLTLSFKDSLIHLGLVKSYYLENSKITPKEIHDKISLYKDLSSAKSIKFNKRLLQDKAVVAFSSHHPFKKSRKRGFSKSINDRYFMMMKNSGIEKPVPITITTVALDIIFRSKPNTILRVAMFALSVRVPEYGALIEAARRKVQVKLLLDRKTNVYAIEKLKAIAVQENIPLEIRFGKRSMHQKYIVDLCLGNVLTGTANMTTDASNRHAEHRFIFRSNKPLAKSFACDFDEIWNRITLR